MPKTVGFTLSVGARMASSVGSVFNTVAGRAARLKSDLKQVRALSTAAGKLITTRARVTDLRAQQAAGKNVATELAAAERAFASAQRAGAKYNLTVADAAKVHARASSQMQRMESSLKRQEAFMRNSAKRRELQGEIMGTIAAAGMVVAPVKIAVDFESAMADAAKTIDGMRDGEGKLTQEYYKMEAAVKALGRELPLTHNELAALFAAGGQMGLTTAEQLKGFTTVAAHMSVAFNMGTEDAAAAVGGYQTALGLSLEDTREMLDLMNQFANTSSATEKDIAGVVNRIGALGDVAGIAHKPMTAMAATLAAMKIPEDKAATGIKNFMLGLSRGGSATKKQQEAFARIGVDSKKLSVQMQKDAEGTMIAVLGKIKQLPAHLQTGLMVDLFGKESVAPIAALMKNLDLLSNNFTIAADTAQYAGAMQKEFENRAATTANAFTIAKNKAAEVAITLGNSLLPAINDILASAGQMTTAVAAFAQANPEAVTAVMYAVSALAAFKVASLAGGYALTIVSDAWHMAGRVWDFGKKLLDRNTYAMIYQRTVGTALAAGTRLLAVAQMGLNLVMSNNPIGWAVKGAMALAAGLAYLYNTCEPVRKALDWLWDGITAGLKPVFGLLEAAWKKIEAVWGGVKKIASWFSSDEAEAAEAKAEEEKSAAASGAPSSPPASDAPPLSGPSPLPGQSPPDLAAGFPLPPAAAASASGGVTTIAPNLHISISMDGVTDKDFGKRVVESLHAQKSEIERFLGGLLKNHERVAYG